MKILALLSAVLFCALTIPTLAETPDYVGSEACADCHVEATEGWKTSDHAHAWMPPNEETVLGDFNDQSFTHGGLTARFLRDGDKFIIETEGADGIRRPYEVIGVAGIKPLQQYLLSPEPGRIQTFDIAWDVDEKRWYPVFADQPAPPGDGFHWTGPYKSWEARCAECHATGYSRNYQPETRNYAPQMSEIGVGCEGCHGPGAAHIAWAKDPAGFVATTGLSPLGLTASLGASQTAQVQQCMTCHSVREAMTDGNPVPGTPYHDTFTLSTLRPGSYFPDGQILGEVYEGGSFLQSKMFAKGVACSNCHDPHSGALKAEGNAVCTQCHSPAGNSDFPSLPLKVFDGPEHTFHPEGTPGAQCVNCHMTERTYMGIDERRDHSFRIPRPDLNASTGAPDACTTCHTDKDAEWAAAEIAKRYPDSTHRGPHFGTVFAAARQSPEGQVAALIDIAEWAGPGIVRATAIELLPPLPAGPQIDRVAKLVVDPDPLVRTAAVGAFRGLSQPDRLRILTPSLTDPAKTVREATALALVDVQLPPDYAALPALQAAMEEWHASLALRGDFPETHLQIGGAALMQRNLPVALRAFGEAVTQDPQLADAWSMIVRILMAQGDMQNAEAALNEAVRLNPNAPALFDLEQQFGGSLLPPGSGD